MVIHDGVHATLTQQILKCAIEVHRHLGPGLLESIYESALCFELTGLRVGLVLNFNSALLTHGIRRVIL
jgi:hypothetical protein